LDLAAPDTGCARQVTSAGLWHVLLTIPTTVKGKHPVGPQECPILCLKSLGRRSGHHGCRLDLEQAVPLWSHFESYRIVPGLVTVTAATCHTFEISFERSRFYCCLAVQSAVHKMAIRYQRSVASAIACWYRNDTAQRDSGASLRVLCIALLPGRICTSGYASKAFDSPPRVLLNLCGLHITPCRRCSTRSSFPIQV
jgi:hypothetical protein